MNPSSIYIWARSKLVCDGVVYMTSSLISSELAQPYMEYEYIYIWYASYSSLYKAVIRPMIEMYMGYKLDNIWIVKYNFDDEYAFYNLDDKWCRNWRHGVNVSLYIFIHALCVNKELKF